MSWKGGGVVGGHVYLTFIGELEGGGCRRACVIDLHRCIGRGGGGGG